VDPYGNVFPCEYLTEKVGNILDEGISSSGIIGSAAARDMLSKINLPPEMHNAVCKKCEIVEQCLFLMGGGKKLAGAQLFGVRDIRYDIVIE